MNDTISHLSKESSKSDTSKRHSAINDYKRSEKAIERCYYCFKDQNTPPATPVVSIGHRVYLGLPNVKELVPGHCQIIPIEHNITSLDCDDDTWSEIRNFMKCLIRCFDAKKCGVIFMETVIDLKSYYHTVIECIPLPYDQYDDCPAYFKEALLESDSNWSQHSKVIDTSKRGFRRSLTSNLPYFHVWYHLDEGIGHVIEEKEKFPQWFGKEVIAGILDLDPSKWRRPDRYSSRDNGPRIEEFKKKFNWDEFNWTSVLDE
jgi:hypothetical protein